MSRYFNTFGSQILLTTGANLLLGLIGLVAAMFIARLLGVEGRGELAAIQIWPLFISHVAMMGFINALVYFSAREPTLAGRYTGSGTVFSILLSLTFMAVAYLVMPQILAKQSQMVVSAARWYLLFVPLNILVMLPNEALRGRSDMVVWNALRFGPSLGILLVVMLAYLLKKTTPVFIAASQIVMMVCLSLLIIYILIQRVPGPFWPEIRKSRDMIRYGFPSMIGKIFEYLNLRLGLMLMASFLTVQSLGLYAVAVSWGAILNPALRGLGSMTFPRVASIPIFEQRVHAFSQASRLGVLLSIASAIFFLFPTPWIFTLFFGKEFVLAIPSALVLLVASSVSGLNATLEEGILGFGYPKAVMWSKLVGLAVTVIALVLLLKPKEMLGAAIATLVGVVCVSACLVFYARRYTQSSLSNLLIPKLSDLTKIWQKSHDTLVRLLIVVGIDLN